MTLLLDSPFDLVIPTRSFGLLREDSLGATLDAINQAQMEHATITPAERSRLARWIASRPSGYAGLPAATVRDFCEGARLFTGETITSRAGIAHLLGEEAARQLLLLSVSTPLVRRVLRRGYDGMMQRLAEHSHTGRPRGLYCCGRCSVALWRHVAAGGLPECEDLLRDGLRALRKARDGRGGWKTFPFYYTVLALTEICHPAALQELRHAAPALRRMLKSRASASDERYAKRRHLIAERALTIC